MEIKCMPKILVILTGGTIGSGIQSGIIDTNLSHSLQLIELYRQKYNDKKLDFEVIQPINILSENLYLDHWNKLCYALSEINFSRYNGIIITHGTDTLPYTSSVVGLLFGKSPIPIVITASNYPLEDPRSNGLQNFKSAIDFILSSELKGVYTIFQNAQNESIVYLSTRITEADSYLDQFSSFGGQALGRILNGKYIHNFSYINPTIKELSDNSKNDKLTCWFENDILLIRPYPGLNYNQYDLGFAPKAVLHCLYHSSTACTDSENYSLISFISRCKERNIPIYVSSFKRQENYYISSKLFLEMDVIPLFNTSVESAYAKLLIAYNQKVVKPQELIKQNLFFESLPNMRD